jgi:hypothetical protein
MDQSGNTTAVAKDLISLDGHDEKLTIGTPEMGVGSPVRRN